MSNSIRERDLGQINPAPTDLVRIVRGDRSVMGPAANMPVPTAAQTQLNQLRDGQGAGQVVARTWADLSAAAGVAGTGAQVIDDTGTHTDVASSTVVPNQGQYVWNVGIAGWQWVRPDALALKAEAVDVVGSEYFANDGIYYYSVDQAGDSRIAYSVSGDGSAFYTSGGRVEDSASAQAIDTLGFDAAIAPVMPGYTDAMIRYALDADGNTRVVAIEGGYSGPVTVLPAETGEPSETPADYLALLRTTKQALAGLQVGQRTAPLVLAFLGDSWTFKPRRFLFWLSKVLKAAYGDAGPGYVQFCKSSGVWWGSVDEAVAVARSGAWVDSNHAGLSLPNLAGATGELGASYTLTGIPAGLSEVKLFAQGAVNVSYAWNGGAAVTVAGGGATVNVMALTPDPAGGTLVITCLAAGQVLGGVSLEKSAPGIRIHNLGSDGAHSGHWAEADPTMWAAGLAALAPDFARVMLGTNDQKSSAHLPAQFQIDMQTLCTRLRGINPVVDLLVAMPPENGSTDPAHVAPMSAYARAGYQVAQAAGAAFVNHQSLWGESYASYSPTSSRPWMDIDAIHPSDAGGVALAAWESRVLQFL